MSRTLLAVLFFMLAGCGGTPDGHDVDADIAMYAYQNKPRAPGDTGFHAGRGGAAIASSDVPWRVPVACRTDYRDWVGEQDRQRARQADYLASGRCAEAPKQTFVGAAITGGGNKSAVYSAEVLFELERYGLARNIDVVSSVSGGSFTAALYALSCERPPAACARAAADWTPPVWDYATISKHIEANYLMAFLGRRALPNHLLLNATTHHGAADDMADIVAARLLREGDRRLLFSDLNPARPNLILNATNVTQDRAAFDQDAGIPAEDKRPLSDDEALHFSFTQQYFWRLLSRLDDYPLRDAVVASAAFPLLIDRPSLRIYRPEDLVPVAQHTLPRRPEYVSLYDGGVHDNFGLTELRWFVECAFDRNARRTAWTPAIRERMCGSRDLPAVRPRATLIIGINSSLLRAAGVPGDVPKPRSWDSYIGPLRLSGTADSVDLIMAASGELRKMELRSLVEEISRAELAPSKVARAPDDNPFVAPGRHQYVDVDIEAALYLSCPHPVRRDGSYAYGPDQEGSPVILNSGNGGSELSRCRELRDVLAWNTKRGLQLPELAADYCTRDDCPEFDDVVGDRRYGAKRELDTDRMFIEPGPISAPRLINNQMLFQAVREVPTNFELSAHYVRLLRYVARWSVAHRVRQLCRDHRDLLEALPDGAAPTCDATLAPRAVDDNPRRL